VPTCFLFAESLTDEGCLSLRLDDEGRVDSPPQQRSIDEIQTLQINTQTVVVLPTHWCSLHEVELPWLGERKARLAIPYALEDHVAQPVSTLHLAFDKQHYQNNRYQVVVTDARFLTDLIARLDTLGLDFDTLTLDWFALQEHEACVSDSSLLVYDETFRGSLSSDPAAIYLHSHANPAAVFIFNDSAPALIQPQMTALNESFYTWVAKRLLNSTAMNLCQGTLKHDTKQQSSLRWYQLCALLGGALLISALVINAILSYALSQKISTLDEQIAVIYRQFFPKATQVISPKFRINQLITGNAAHQDVDFWRLLEQLGQAIGNEPFVIDRLSYQQKTLSITLTAKDFAALDALQRRLEKAQVHVTQSRAASLEQRVVATLELH
jgi:general secretion pathway protein L